MHSCNPAPVTVVKVGPKADQFVVCRSCLERMIREGEWSVQGSRITPSFDFVLSDPLGQPIVAVAVKSSPWSRSVDLEKWATSMRRNLAAHSALPSTPYFLLFALPDVAFLWSNPDAAYDSLPDYSLSLQDLAMSGVVPFEDGRDAEQWVKDFLERLVAGEITFWALVAR